MIKMWMNHKIIDYCINKLFDGLINTFGEKEKIKVGGHYKEVSFLFYSFRSDVKYIYHDVDVIAIDDINDTIKIKSPRCDIIFCYYDLNYMIEYYNKHYSYFPEYTMDESNKTITLSNCRMRNIDDPDNDICEVFLPTLIGFK